MAQNGARGGRIEWVDVAKGLGVLLIIFGHILYSGTWEAGSRAIYSFHVPMFFILSGFIARTSRRAPGKFALDKARQLLLPSLIFILLTLPLYIKRVYGAGIPLSEHIRLFLFVDGSLPYNGAIWFFIVMFEVTVLYELIRAPVYTAFEKCAGACVCFILGALVRKTGVFLPFGLDRAIIALGFYFTGGALASASRALPRRAMYVIVPACAFIWFMCGCVYNVNISFSTMKFGNYVHFIVAAVCGSVVWFTVCWLIRRVNVFAVWGQNTIFIVGTQIIGVNAVRYISRRAGLEGTWYMDVISFIAAVAAMFLYMPICAFINKRLPFLNGRRNVIRE